MLSGAEDVARSNGYTSLGLNVFGPNAAARALYDSAGYEVTAVQMLKPLARDNPAIENK